MVVGSREMEWEGKNKGVWTDSRTGQDRVGRKTGRSLADSGQWNMRFVIVMCLVPSVCELRCF